jgi:hypothetical protein
VTLLHASHITVHSTWRAAIQVSAEPPFDGRSADGTASASQVSRQSTGELLIAIGFVQQKA